MKLHLSANAIVLALSIGAACTGLAFAATEPQAQGANQAGARSRLDIAHEKTMAAAKKAYDTGAAATEALCRQDRALQTRTRNAAASATKELEAAAQAEADETPEVAQAHYTAIGAGLAMNGAHPPEELEKLKNDMDGKFDAYDALKDARAKAIKDEALLQVTGPTTAGGCPPPSAAPQRNASAPPPSLIPPLPATPQRATTMLKRFSDAAFKATIAQPGLRSRIETLFGLEGCDWSVVANVAAQVTPRRAATYLNRLNDDDLRMALSDAVLLDRMDMAVGRGNCAIYQQPNPTAEYPLPDYGPNADPGPYPYPYGYPPDGYGPGYPYGGYGGYGGYGPDFIP